MPAIDLARLRKQASRLADFFYVPDEFIKHLHAMLDFYVDRSIRTRQAAAPGTMLPTYHTPRAVIKQIQVEVARIAGDFPDATLELADRLWDESYLELRLLAAFLLGRIPPEEGRLLARLTAWTGQIRDPKLRAELLSTSLARMRKEAPGIFFDVIGEWLQAGRTHLWSNGIQAILSAVSDPSFVNLPPVLKVIEPVLEAAPARLQVQIQELVLALFASFPSETTYFLRQVLSNTSNPQTLVMFRRILPSLPAPLRRELEEFLTSRSISNL